MRGQSLSDFEFPEEVKGENVFTCPFPIDKLCMGERCLEEWRRTDEHRSLQIFYYDEVRDKKKGLFKSGKVKEHHIVKRVMHHEGFCRLFQKEVWTLHGEIDTDLWFEEGSETFDTPYILKKIEVEEDADEG